MQYEMIKPDDWHCHLRDEPYLSRTVTDTAAQFQRAIVMPNLETPITSSSQALAYRDRIMKYAPKTFQPLMTLYLTESLSPDAIEKKVVAACKYYPAGGTTHADAGIRTLDIIYRLFEKMQSIDMPLCMHGEALKADIFDREKLFLTDLKKLQQDFPKLRIILEHISTKAAVEFVEAAPNTLAATITPHHLHYSRDDLFRGGVRPHYYCMPILKRREDQQALIQAAISGNPKFFLGTDSAPHAREKKESACGCAGIYSAHAALSFYAEIFEQNDAMDRLEKFSSVFGAEFYQLPVNREKIAIVKKPCKIPDTLPFGDTLLIPMKAGETTHWQPIHP
ncbi:MAG: dihydroorotase [Gammaproteobacteria bacterium RIFCSPHIGHO2_12_FULL_38_14]|nr:MAG: dihydroorotase [Gammaproteobacteria bacterium RIFCSPHIGHO2_12_FULL_38_14]